MNFVYLAYGLPRILDQTRLSILTLLHFSKNYGDFRIIVYSDQPSAFAGLPVEFREVSLDEIDTWKGPDKFIHRPKVKMLQDYFERFGGTVIYLDSDVLFYKDPFKLFLKVDGHNSLMFIREGKISDGLSKANRSIFRLIRAGKFVIPWNSKTPVPLDTGMYNAGVIGLDSSYSEIPDQALELTDAWYALDKRHIMEQFAWSLLLEQKTQIHTVEDLSVHFWGNGAKAEPKIAKFLLLVANLPLREQSKEAVKFTATHMKKYHDPYYQTAYKRKLRWQPWKTVRYFFDIPDHMIEQPGVGEYHWFKNKV